MTFLNTGWTLQEQTLNRSGAHAFAATCLPLSLRISSGAETRNFSSLGLDPPGASLATPCGSGAVDISQLRMIPASECMWVLILNFSVLPSSKFR
jgi:hypothetical protein